MSVALGLNCDQPWMVPSSVANRKGARMAKRPVKDRKKAVKANNPSFPVGLSVIPVNFSGLLLYRTDFVGQICFLMGHDFQSRLQLGRLVEFRFKPQHRLLDHVIG